MNIQNKNTRELAEKLKSLSFETTQNNTAPTSQTGAVDRKGWMKHPVLYISAAALLLGAIGVGIWFPFLKNWVTVPSHERVEIPLETEFNSKIELTTATNSNEKSFEQVNLIEQQEISGSGYVIAPIYTDVFSQHAGQITKIPVAIGDQVSAGQILLEMDNQAANIRLEEVKLTKKITALVERAATIAIDEARAKLESRKKLFAQKIISQQALMRAKADFQSKDNALMQAKLNVSAADMNILKTQRHIEELIVRAPIDGVITKMNAKIGDSVPMRADSLRGNRSLFTIVDLSNLLIEADIGETNIALVKNSLHGEAVLDSFPNQPFEIKLVHIAPVLSKEKGTISVHLSFTAPPKDIRPNMAVRINLQTTLEITTPNKGE